MNLYLGAILMITIASAESILNKPKNEDPSNVQYHSQDDRGQYKYGYSNSQSSKEETRSSDGITRGSYSYTDPNGRLQKVTYQADAENGFKLTSNSLLPTLSLPVTLNQVDRSNEHKVENGDPPQISGNEIEKSLTKFESNSASNEENINFVKNIPEAVLSHRVDQKTEVKTSEEQKLDQNNAFLYLPQSNPTIILTPSPLSILPYPNPFLKIFPIYTADFRNAFVPYRKSNYFLNYPKDPQLLSDGLIFNIENVAGKGSQYHLQNGQGHYAYGYTNDLSAKNEIKGTDGVTRGSYSYVDTNGDLQAVSYTADAENGFRVTAANLPLGPVAVPQN